MSNETKFTPGPWKWDGCVWDYNPSEQAPWLLHKNTGLAVLLGEMRCIRANANLIAAAPELYEALDYLLKHNRELVAHGVSVDAYLMASADAALAKARGEHS